jgi:hypothetical protein
MVGPVWLIGGTATDDDWQAAYELQRLGYFDPTVQGREDVPESAKGFSKLGWKITDLGIDVVARLAVEKAA